MRVELMSIPTDTLMGFAGVSAGAMGGALEAKQNRICQFDFVEGIGWSMLSKFQRSRMKIRRIAV
jgi:hypothetical protein